MKTTHWFFFRLTFDRFYQTRININNYLPRESTQKARRQKSMRVKLIFCFRIFNDDRMLFNSTAKRRACACPFYAKSQREGFEFQYFEVFRWVSALAGTLNMISADAALREIGSRGVHKYAEFSHPSVTLNPLCGIGLALQRYSPEQQEAQTRNRGSSNVIVNIGDLLQQKKIAGTAYRARNSNLPSLLLRCRHRDRPFLSNRIERIRFHFVHAKQAH